MARIVDAPLPEIPLFDLDDCPDIHPGLWFWDFWPAEIPDGTRVVADGAELWFALSSPVLDDPEERHAQARIHMLIHQGSQWRDLGPALPDGFSPGSREWSGSAIVENGWLNLYFTAAGRRGEASVTYEQRVFHTRAEIDDLTFRTGEWTAPVELFWSDGVTYAHAREATGKVGTIKAFRDPAWFRDPHDGVEYILFTGSLCETTSSFSGCVGLARRDGETWTLLPPVVTADDVNNELERPHVRARHGRYHLYWSTQAHVFSPEIKGAQTGVYGMTADSLRGPYEPIGQSGLVACNPAAAPSQAYSWWVQADGAVSSFADVCRPLPSGGFAGRLAPIVYARPLLSD